MMPPVPLPIAVPVGKGEKGPVEPPVVASLGAERHVANLDERRVKLVVGRSLSK
jgi:hypothetical protein